MKCEATEKQTAPLQTGLLHRDGCAGTCHCIFERMLWVEPFGRAWQNRTSGTGAIYMRRCFPLIIRPRREHVTLAGPGRTTIHGFMHLEYRLAMPADAPECVRLRGLTRENAVSAQRLARLGITAESWATEISSGELHGFISTAGGHMAGYCFGASKTGEVMVLAVLPDYENKGVGRRLLDLVVARLLACGHDRLYLGCSSDSSSRSHGFYRYLGWRSTGSVDHRGDEILELLRS